MKNRTPLVTISTADANSIKRMVEALSVMSSRMDKSSFGLTNPETKSQFISDQKKLDAVVRSLQDLIAW